MSNTFGTNVKITLFGESHGEEIGVVLDGFPVGVSIDEGFIAKKLSLRRPTDELSTARKEEDKFRILSGVYRGKTTGAPIAITIPNENVRSGDYAPFALTPRPSHADYTAQMKYKGFQDPRGGGHFSGRITAPLVAAGAIAQRYLQEKGVYIGTHILRLHGKTDRKIEGVSDLLSLAEKTFPVLDEEAEKGMKEEILQARADGDSVGGVLETAVYGLPAGLGEPFFDSAESKLAHILFSVPAVKGVEFGSGFSLADMRGSEANDCFCIKDGKIQTTSNHNGGVLGGITNGMPVVFRTAVKPTPSIYQEQKTVSLAENKEVVLKIQGRHDPCIAHRARAVVDAVTALCIVDLFSLVN